MIIPFEVQCMKDEGALFIVNHSGGKDSQAMTAKLADWLGDYPHVQVVHASLGEMEWEGTIEHIHATIPKGWPFHVVQARKTLLEMVDRRHAARPGAPCWPSPKHRQCTSDLKRDPIARYVRSLKWTKTPIIHCMGLRAEESPARSKQPTFSQVMRESRSGRSVWRWLPVHELSTEKVFETIQAAGQLPHWAYSKGMRRCSCCFCIMSNTHDLQVAAKLNPELYQAYLKREQKTGYTMFHNQSLKDRVEGGIRVR